MFDIIETEDVKCTLGKIFYGSEESTYRETSVHGHSIPYVTPEDISLLEWLFAQRRETSE